MRTKKVFMLVYLIDPESGERDEVFVNAHNITEARPKLLALLKPSEKAIAIFESVKHQGWVEREL